MSRTWKVWVESPCLWRDHFQTSYGDIVNKEKWYLSSSSDTWTSGRPFPFTVFHHGTASTIQLWVYPGKACSSTFVVLPCSGCPHLAGGNASTTPWNLRAQARTECSSGLQVGACFPPNYCGTKQIILLCLVEVRRNVNCYIRTGNRTLGQEKLIVPGRQTDWSLNPARASYYQMPWPSFLISKMEITMPTYRRDVAVNLGSLSSPSNPLQWPQVANQGCHKIPSLFQFLHGKTLCSFHKTV